LIPGTISVVPSGLVTGLEFRVVDLINAIADVEDVGVAADAAVDRVVTVPPISVSLPSPPSR